MFSHANLISLSFTSAFDNVNEKLDTDLKPGLRPNIGASFIAIGAQRVVASDDRAL